MTEWVTVWVTWLGTNHRTRTENQTNRKRRSSGQPMSEQGQRCCERANVSKPTNYDYTKAEKVSRVRIETTVVYSAIFWWRYLCYWQTAEKLHSVGWFFTANYMLVPICMNLTCSETDSPLTLPCCAGESHLCRANTAAVEAVSLGSAQSIHSAVENGMHS